MYNISNRTDTPLNDADHVGSFNFLGRLIWVWKKHESALTIEEQVNNLKSLNLIIKEWTTSKRFS